MPAKSEKQRIAAAIELRKRREGKRKKNKKGKRAFAGASMKTLEDFARYPG